MPNPNPRIDQLKNFEKGRKKTGGREKGTPNKLKPDDVMNIVQECLQEEITFFDQTGTKHKKQAIHWMIIGWMKKVSEKGDAKGMELLLRIFGLLKDNVNLSGDVQLKSNISTDQIFAELGSLVKSVRDRKTTDSKKSTKV